MSWSEHLSAARVRAGSVVALGLLMRSTVIGWVWIGLGSQFTVHRGGPTVGDLAPLGVAGPAVSDARLQTGHGGQEGDLGLPGADM